MHETICPYHTRNGTQKHGEQNTIAPISRKFLGSQPTNGEFGHKKKTFRDY